MKTKKDPRSLRRRGHEYERHQTNRNDQAPCCQPFPVCELHGVGIVTRFPDGCPLAERNPLAKIAEMNEAAWQLRGDSDPKASAMFACADTCHRCVECKLRDPHVKMLRGDAND